MTPEILAYLKAVATWQASLFDYYGGVHTDDAPIYTDPGSGPPPPPPPPHS